MCWCYNSSEESLETPKTRWKTKVYLAWTKTVKDSPVNLWMGRTTIITWKDPAGDRIRARGRSVSQGEALSKVQMIY
jgi:hypothetical protein